MGEDWDLVVIGAGVAGLSAGLFGARSGLKTLLIEKQLPGGQLVNAPLMEFFPGFPEGIKGMELAAHLERQCARHGIETVNAEAYGVSPGEPLVVKTTEGTWTAGALVIATGAEPKKLALPAAERFEGRGVSYCASCDAHFFRDRPVAVIGGGDSALDEALYLASIASKVTVVHRSPLKACRSLQERTSANPKIEFVADSVIEAIEGADGVDAVRLDNLRTGEARSLPVSGVFVYVGQRPATEFLDGVLELSEDGRVVTGSAMETSEPGIFACGAACSRSDGQAITAAADGARAALAAARWIAR